MLQHLAIIMDGNARWAAGKGLSKAQGHKAGAGTIKKLIPGLLELEIPYVTLYAFSLENWQRSKEETTFLTRLLHYYLKREISALHKQGIKIKIIGNFAPLSCSMQNQVQQAMELTKNNHQMTLCIAFSYGGRMEIIEACQKIVQAGRLEIDQASFKDYLYDPDMPDVDLLIRTGGAARISNFLLWQTAYAELAFLTKYWPDFDKADIVQSLADYAGRTRNFGTRQS